jgi:hypothetical protein
MKTLPLAIFGIATLLAKLTARRVSEENNMKSVRRGVACWGIVAFAVLYGGPARGAGIPENVAPKAQVAATSEYSELYLARFAVDGKIPTAGSQGADRGAAWCVRKAATGDAADFTLQWQEPVDVAEIVYWGRTAWYMTECFKDYEVYLDESPQPAVRGTLKMLHGPQPIKLPQGKCRRMVLKFLSSYGGANPGAAEIQVYGTRLSERDLAGLSKQSPDAAAEGRAAKEATFDGVRQLIEQLQENEGSDYPEASGHLARLGELERARQQVSADDQSPEAEDQGEAIAEQLERLQRDVLLFDVQNLVAIKRHEITASHVYTYHYEGFKPGGGLYRIAPQTRDREPVELVASTTGQILDCDLSYDGRTVLFSWRRKEDEGYHLWKIGVDGSGLVQLTEGIWHDYNACWLPDGGIAFLSTRSPQFAYCWHAPVGILHRMDLDGDRPAGVRRLSGNYLNDFTPAVLDDGRIVYSRWEYVDRPAIPIQSMWTLNPDGSGLSVFFGNRVLSPGTFMEAQPIPGTSRVICTMTGHNGPARGAIGVIDRSRGVNAQAAIENVTPDVPVPKVDEGNGNTNGTKPYSSPYALDQERFLVSARGPVLVRTLSGECQAVAVEAPTDGMQWFSARPVRPRHRPPAIPSSLEPDAEPYATVFLQDVYNGLEPYVRRGEVTHIRVVRELPKTVRIDPSLRAFGFQFPVISCGATYAGKHVLGDVPVGPDGSVSFRVPSGIPLYFIALDGQGRAVQRMRSFTHFMPGEVQGCIGCHEHRLQASRPKIVLAGFQPPADPQPPEWGDGGFDYSRVVQPVLDRHCVECHGAVDPAGGVDLGGAKTDFFNVSYDVLARQGQGPRGSPYISWIPTYNGQEQNILDVTPKHWGSPESRLAQLVLSGHPDAEGKPQIAMDDASKRRILAWIDLNVPYYGSSETAYPENEGCRRIYPAELDKVLSEVAGRRCAACHAEGKIPRREWTRITEPQWNSFLLAPLAKTAGGSEKCGQAVFQATDDPDYQAILATFKPVEEMLRRQPRMDMPGAKPSCEVSRSCQ